MENTHHDHLTTRHTELIQQLTHYQEQLQRAQLAVQQLHNTIMHTQGRLAEVTVLLERNEEVCDAPAPAGL